MIRIARVAVGFGPGGLFTLRVLVVEDDGLVSLMLIDYVDQLGHQVAGTVFTVAAALEELRNSPPPDVVLLDVDLAGELSYPVADHCRVEGIPVVLTTGFRATQLPEGLRHCPRVEKPFTLDELEQAIEKATNVGNGRPTSAPVSTLVHEFHVQTYDSAGQLQPGVKVSAQSAVQAASMALGETLVMHGPLASLRARVWRIGENLSPIVTDLYRPTTN